MYNSDQPASPLTSLPDKRELEDGPYRAFEWTREQIEELVRETKLCKACMVMIGPREDWAPLQDDEYRDWYKHHRTCEDLVEAAEAGCRICKILQRRLAARPGVWDFEGPSDGEQEEGTPRRQFFLSYSNYSHQNPLCFTFYPRRKNYADRNMYMTQFYLCSGSPELAGSVVPRLDHREAFPLLQTWFAACVGDASHAICQTYRGMKRLKPTRLLYLDPNMAGAVRLIGTEDSKNYPYATLSHRWGRPEPPKLSLFDTPERQGIISLQTLRAGLHISCLPHIFQDAIQVARRCSVEYLWIDCLCIVQDRDSDGRNLEWEHEAEKMGDIYAGGLFNIAAVDAQNSDGSLFPAGHRILLPVVKKQSPVDSEAGKVFFVQEDPFYEFSGEILSGELLTRGWVYQEILLTPANLLFTKEKMWWSCFHASCSQTFPRVIPAPNTRDPYGYNSFMDNIRGDKAVLLSDGQSASMYPGMTRLRHMTPMGLWQSVIRSYGRTSVTFDDDRLVAIAGITKTFRRAFSDLLGQAAYHSGLWSEEVIQQLTWSRDSGVLPFDRITATHPIPSWSPASCRTSFDHNSRITRAEKPLPIEVIGTEAIGLDQFGRAVDKSQCSLHLRGVLLPVEFNAGDAGKARPVGFLGEHPLEVIWDTEADMKMAQESSGRSLRVLLLHFDPRMSRESFHPWLDGLLLRPLDEAKPSVDGGRGWLRCGYVIDYMVELETDVAAYQEALQIRKYGFTWVADHPEANRYEQGWRWVCTGAPPELENIFIF